MLPIKIKIDSLNVRLKIEYEVDDDMSPIGITNDTSHLFYTELKDSRSAAYALHVEIEELLNINVAEFGIRLDSSYSKLAPALESGRSSNFSLHSSLTNPMIEEFASSMEISHLALEEREDDENYGVLSATGDECIAVNKIFEDIILLKKSIALFIIQNNFQFSDFH
ncbi:Hypothetical predicted protein [Olea europaea subsp. europaea]|uniref:Uncharacterized protein n=1 Tax=Olea europaea subsp. europaea TaxID=158383 RepID=A0A8S0V2R9_OLEEU|nr:Hypothetical predicted protein [Olea europaea subsp. europaea]